MIDAFIQRGQADFKKAKNTTVGHGMLANVQGIWIELRALSQSASGFSVDPVFQAKTAQCDERYPASSMFGQQRAAFCKVDLILGEYKKVIIAQHSISNMYHALVNTRYHALASELI